MFINMPVSERVKRVRLFPRTHTHTHIRVDIIDIIFYHLLLRHTQTRHGKYSKENWIRNVAVESAMSPRAIRRADYQQPMNASDSICVRFRERLRFSIACVSRSRANDATVSPA